jgi:menaquinone-dependent protoporphyrinogen oxidase
MGVQVEQPSEAPSDPTRYDLLVLGSAVYSNQWLPAATCYLRCQAAALATTRVAVFSSGLGAPSRFLPGGWGHRLQTGIQQSFEHRYFYGHLDREVLSLRERLMMDILGTPDGDRRDWTSINQWALMLADQVRLARGRTSLDH